MNKQGSFSIEYALMIAVIVAALVGTGVYLKRALSDKWRNVGNVFGHGRQYDPQTTTITTP